LKCLEVLSPIEKAMPETLLNHESITAAAEPVEEHKYLLANSLVHEDGFGPGIDLGRFRGHAVAIHLEIDHVVQHKALRLSVWGSADGTNWGSVPLVSLPPKHYCGNYAVPLDLSRYPEVRYLRAGWKTISCQHSAAATLFGFSVIVEPPTRRHRLADKPKTAATAASSVLTN
jgi:hypothetical protein